MPPSFTVCSYIYIEAATASTSVVNPEIHRTVQVVMPFATTYFCDEGFSALTAIKTKNRNRMDAEADVRLKLSDIIPNFTRLCSSKQAHPSY